MKIDPPLPHQKEQMRFLMDRWDEGWGVLVAQMRTRKTSTILYFLEWVRMSKMNAPSILVVCPPKVIPVWEDMKKHFVVGHFITVLSSGALSSKDGPFKGEKPKFDILVLDELHQYRAYSNRYKRLRKLAKEAVYMVGMTGTPIDQDVAEFFYPLTLLSKGGFFGTQSRELFRRTYCYQINPGLTHSPWKMRPEAEEALVGELRKVAHFYDGKDKITPPECEKAAYDITWEQTDWAQRIVGETPIRERVTVKGVETPMMELQAEMPPHARKDKRRQIESGFLLHDGEVVKRFGTNKWGRLQLLLTHCEGQVLVWYRYIEEKREILEITGKKAEFTPKNFEAFKRGESRFMVAHPRAAGAGLDFSCADTAIFVTPNPSNVDVQQALYRLCTVSGSKNKKVYFMVAASPGGREDYRRMTEKFRVTEQLYMKGRA